MIIMLVTTGVVFGAIFGFKWFGNKMMNQFFDNMPMPPVAITATAHKLARIVYHVLSTHQDFNGQFKGRQLSHRKHAQWPRRASPPA